MKYTVVTSTEQEHFVKRVNDAIAQGFRPLGGVCVKPRDDVLQLTYSQAMIQEECIKGPERIIPPAEKPCIHEWHLGRCAHCEIPVSEFRKVQSLHPL